MVWVDFGQGQRVAWHIWHDDALWLVCGGIEQDLPGAVCPSQSAQPPARQATVSVRSAEGVLCFTADVAPVEPGSAEWLSAVPVLHENRLNPPDGEAQPERWARESVILRLTPQPIVGRSPAP